MFINTQNNEEIENLNLQSQENMNYRDSIKLDDPNKLNENSNISEIDVKNKNKNLDSILKNYNSVNTENNNIIIQENENFSDEKKLNHNHLKANAYENDNKNDIFENDLANIGDKTEINENENKRTD